MNAPFDYERSLRLDWLREQEESALGAWSDLIKVRTRSGAPLHIAITAAACALFDAYSQIVDERHSLEAEAFA